MKKNLFLPLIILSQALSVQAHSLSKEKLQELEQKTHNLISAHNAKLAGICDSKVPNLEEATAQSNKIWKEIVQQINNARISYSLSGGIELSDRFAVKIGGRSYSKPSIGDKFSGVDKWNVKLDASLIESEILGLDFNATREVTFVQQFDSRCESLVRVPYDPVTKIPSTSERALNRLKVGDFVAYSAPMTLSLGKSLKRYLDNDENARATGGIFAYVSGEFNIHVYRMDDNRVRVRFFAANTKGAGVNLGLKFYVVDDLLSVKPLKAEVSQALTNLFSADYVFNLNDTTAQKLYDKAMGKKFDITKIDLKELKGINPFEKDENVQNRLFADLSAVDQASLDDLNKNLNDRRIVRLSKSDTETKSSSFSLGIDLRILEFKTSRIRSDSVVSTYNVENENENYSIKTITNESKFDVVNNLYGKKNMDSMALLTRLNNTTKKPESLSGFQMIRNTKDANFSHRELKSVIARLNRLPEGIKKTLKVPNPDTLKSSIDNASIEQSIFLDPEAIAAQGSITSGKVAATLENLIQTWGRIYSDPMDLQGVDRRDSRLLARIAADSHLDRGEHEKASAKYLEAFSWDIPYIANALDELFNRNSSMEVKARAYDKLRYNVPLFNEVGTILLLDLIGQSDAEGRSSVKMEDAVSYRLEITGRGIGSQVSEYPAGAPQNLRKSEIFRRILNDNAYRTDRSLNLNYYMDENGKPLSLKEVVSRSK